MHKTELNKAFFVVVALVFLLSSWNWYEEGHYQYFIWSNFGAILGVSVTFCSYILVSRKKWLPLFPYLVACGLASFLSVIVYCYYAFNGQAENSASSAAQMHILLIPIVLVVVSVVLLLIATIACVSIKALD